MKRFILTIALLLSASVLKAQSSDCTCTPVDTVKSTVTQTKKVKHNQHRANHHRVKKTTQPTTHQVRRTVPVVRYRPSRVDCSCVLDTDLSLVGLQNRPTFDMNIAPVTYNNIPFQIEEFINPTKKRNYLLYGLLTAGTIYALWPRNSDETKIPPVVVVPPMSPVPEPNSALLLVAGLFGVYILKERFNG